MEYSFYVQNSLAPDGMTMAIDKLLKDDLSQKLTPRSLWDRKEKPSAKTVARNKRFQAHFDGDFLKPPVVVCIGSDLAIGDSLGPIVGSMLTYKTQGAGAYIYGTLGLPVTAKEMKYFRTFLQETHPGEQIIAVDAAVGAEGDIGLMKVVHSPLSPGAGANKKLGEIGDLSIMGIVAEKSLSNFGILNTTRLNLVYSMAERITEALSGVIWERQKNTSRQVKSV